jgi:hypothetical protein
MEVVARRVASIAALALFVVLGTEPSARASDAEVTADATAQFYDVRSPTGQTVLMRRRLTATLGVGEYNIFDAPLADPHEGDLIGRIRGQRDDG